MKMVSNSESNHFEELRDLLAGDVKRIVIASPFLAQNIDSLLEELSFSGIEIIELVTTFKPDDAEQITKPFVLRVTHCWYELYGTSYKAHPTAF